MAVNQGITAFRQTVDLGVVGSSPQGALEKPCVATSYVRLFLWPGGCVWRRGYPGATSQIKIRSPRTPLVAPLFAPQFPRWHVAQCLTGQESRVCQAAHGRSNARP